MPKSIKTLEDRVAALELAFLDSEQIHRTIREAYMPQFTKAIKAGDDYAIRQLWDEISELNKHQLWRYFSSWQKGRLRLALQETWEQRSD